MLKCAHIDNPKLSVLSLAQMPLHRGCLEELMPAVARSTWLKDLNVSNAKIDIEGGRSVASMIDQNKVHLANLSAE